MSERLPRVFISVLMGLYESGGSAVLDVHGRLQASKTKSPLNGEPVAWLRLMAAGLIAGEDGLILLTEKGRMVASEYERGRVREA